MTSKYMFERSAYKDFKEKSISTDMDKIKRHNTS